MQSKLDAKRRHVIMLGQRALPEDMREAVNMHSQIAEEQVELDAKRRKLQDLSSKQAKATADRLKKHGGEQELLMENVNLVPMVTTQNTPLTLPEVERAQSLAEQLNNTTIFERAATYVCPCLVCSLQT